MEHTTPAVASKEDARSSFTGQRLTEAQFDEVWALSGIMRRSIEKTGSFKEKLGDYAYAFARTEKFDAIKGEEIIRDIFKARHGQTMNQMREGLMAREELARQQQTQVALAAAYSIEGLIKEAETMPFYKAFDQAGHHMAKTLDITENGAKAMMKEAFLAAENRDLYESGKALEAQYRPPEQVFNQQSQTRTRAHER